MNGIININKPLGMTSYDVVHKLKKICMTTKIGHTGTLDPDASGVLPVCIGKATKIVDYIMSDSKEYKVALRLGLITDTYDASGRILQEKELQIGENQVINAINSFLGDISQVPPMYSALKVDGKRLYDLARKGIEIERKPRNITIHSIEIEKICLPDVIFTVKCSKGTYIRSLCYDIGNLLGCGGTMWALERTASGVFTIENSVNLEELTLDKVMENLIPIDEALSKYEVTSVDEKFEKLLVNGVEVMDRKAIDGLVTGVIYRVYTSTGKFIGLGEFSTKGFKIVKLLL